MAQVKVIQPIVQQAAKIRVAAYARVSSGSDDQLNSFATQVEHYTKLIETNEDWTLADIYADEAITGLRADKRPEFQRLLQDCRAGKIDRVLVKSISRFARNTVDCIETVRELSALGISVEFEKENIDTSSMGGEMLLSMLGAAAQEESLSISKNLRWSIQRRMRKGEYITDSAPYGYRLSNGTLEICEEEAKVVQEIFDLYLSGNGFDFIAAALTQKCVACKLSSAWNYSVIRYIIKNEKYIGDSLLQKKFTEDVLPLKRYPNEGQRPQYYVSNTHAPIISREAFEHARHLCEQRSEKHQISKCPQPAFLSKTVFCGHCGTSCKHMVTRNGNDTWNCRAHYKNKENCPVKPVFETDIHRAFLFAYNKLVNNRSILLGSLLNDLNFAIEKTATRQAGTIEINREIAELLTKNHTLARLQTKGCIDMVTYTRRANELNKKISVLRQTLVQLRSPGTLEAMLDKTKILLGILEDTPPLAHFDGAIFTQAVTRVILHNQAIEFELINGLRVREEQK